MRHIRKLSILLALCLVLVLLPVTSASAAEGSSIWLRHLPADGGETIALVADAPVASGVITITYDSDRYTFQGMTVDSSYVLAHAVNDQEVGMVKISWIGTDAGSGAHVLMRLQFAVDYFSSSGDPTIHLSGSVQNANGEVFAFTSLNFGDFNAAAYQAESLKAEDYTADSFAAVQAALDAANAQANAETVSQAQLDAATAELTAAMENLVVYTPEPPATEPPATEPAPTEPAPTEPTQPGSTPAQTDSTQPTQAPTPAPKGDNGWLLYILAVLVAVAAVAAVVISKKRGRK